MTNYVQRAAGIPLSDEEREQLRRLAELPDSEIDCSDIPESTEEQLRNARPRRSKPVVMTTLGKAS